VNNAADMAEGMKMNINSKNFRVRPGEKVNLTKWPTHVKPVYKSRKKYHKLLEEHVEELSALQRLLYASNRYALLLIFQAMDAAGKDGAIRHVMSGINPQGCQVFSFKHPSATELDHDFLWRTTACLPERGRIGIFNRSYYEEVLVVRVHPELLGWRKLPQASVTKGIWKERLDDIAGFERYLARQGTTILKFFLHVSRKEQKRRFLQRLEQPEKNWKFSPADLGERRYWDDYMAAYEDAIRRTASREAPWYVVPADNKWYTRLVVAGAIVEALWKLDLAYPGIDAARGKEIAAARRSLMREKG